VIVVKALPNIGALGTHPFYVRPLGLISVILPKLAGFTGGAFMFCTREAFHATGGFNERLYWAEEIAFALALKRAGRFVVLWERVPTSGRRFRQLSGLQLLVGGVRMVSSPFKTFTQRSSVERVWYDSNRADDDKMPKTLAVRVSNGIALVVVIALATGPAWNLIPWSLTPMGSPLGKFRLAIGTLLCHAGLLFWPVAIIVKPAFEIWAGDKVSWATVAVGQSYSQGLKPQVDQGGMQGGGA
jgi:hypothetical protein